MPVRDFIAKLDLFAKCEAGAIAVYAAVAMPILVGAVGMSIDLAQVYLVHERLSRALDAAALAVAGSGLETEQEMQARAEEFMERNYPEDKIGVAYDVHITVDGGDVSVSASADYTTMFVRVLGIEDVTVDASTTVRKQVKGIEAVLVLDNTGSMDYTPPGASMTNMAALKAASTNFVDIMFDKATDPEDIRIGLVPFANAVRVGLYGIGQVPDPTTGLQKAGEAGIYNGGATFVTLPSGMNYSTNHGTTTKNNWYGCVVEHLDSDSQPYNSAAVTRNNTSSAGDRGQIWTVGTLNYAGHGWNPALGNNDPYPRDVTDDYEGPWDIYNYGSVTRGSCLASHCSEYRCDQWHCTRYRSDGSCRNYSSTVCDVRSTTVCETTTCDQYAYSWTTGSTPNSGCPVANILPLTSDEAEILKGISKMSPSGNTQGNAGMIWGYRLISPEEPFTEGAAWASQYWTKAVIMMTDGDNTMDGTYSSLWATAKNDIYASAEDRPSGSTVPTLDDRVSAVCDALDDEDVLVYTIVFQSERAVSDETKRVYRECATEDDMYFYAPTQEDLQETFAHIARELSNLHITD